MGFKSQISDFNICTSTFHLKRPTSSFHHLFLSSQHEPNHTLYSMYFPHGLRTSEKGNTFAGNDARL